MEGRQGEDHPSFSQNLKRPFMHVGYNTQARLHTRDTAMQLHTVVELTTPHSFTKRNTFRYLCRAGGELGW